MIRGFVAAVLAAVFACAPAYAGVTVYTDESAFLAASGGQQYLFDQPQSGPTSITAGPLTIEAPHVRTHDDVYRKIGPNYVQAIGGSMTVHSRTSAFGLLIGSFYFDLPYTFSAGDESGSGIAPFYAPVRPPFLGFISDDGPIDVTFAWMPSSAAEIDIPAYFAAGVPEPVTWTMLIAGFAIIGGALRRRRSGGRSGQSRRVPAMTLVFAVAIVVSSAPAEASTVIYEASGATENRIIPFPIGSSITPGAYRIEFS